MNARENAVQEKSLQFAVRIVKLCRIIRNEKHEYELASQLLRSGTSIGANVYESGRAVSLKDFANKIAIAQKEADETLYWIELLYGTNYLSYKQYVSIRDDCVELIKILMAISRTISKKNSMVKDPDESSKT